MVLPLLVIKIGLVERDTYMVEAGSCRYSDIVQLGLLKGGAIAKFAPLCS